MLQLSPRLRKEIEAHARRDDGVLGDLAIIRDGVGSLAVRILGAPLLLVFYCLMAVARPFVSQGPIRGDYNPR